MDERPDFELLESRTVFEGRVLGLEVDRVRLRNGHVSELEVVRHPGAVAIAAVTADGDVLMVRQFRYATGDWLLEVPAGKLDHPEKNPRRLRRASSRRRPATAPAGSNRWAGCGPRRGSATRRSACISRSISSRRARRCRTTRSSPSSVSRSVRQSSARSTAGSTTPSRCAASCERPGAFARIGDRLRIQLTNSSKK